MNLKHKNAKSACLLIILFLYSFLIFNLCASNLLAQNQDCPSCPKKEEQKAQQDQPKAKEYMVGDMKVIEIPSKYSQEELKKMFPVPEQWKEWYQLEKEGKLPKYVKIIDAYETKLNHCKQLNTKSGKKQPCKIDFNEIIDSMIILKNDMNSFDVSAFLNKIREDGVNLVDEIDQGHQYNIQFLPILIEHFEKSDPSEISYTGTAILNLIGSYLSHPLFWKDQIEEMKKCIPEFWKIIKNVRNIAESKEDQEYIICIAVDAIYMLSDDKSFNEVTSYLLKNNISAWPSRYNSYYYDPLNGKYLYYSDIKLKTYFTHLFHCDDVSKQYVSIKYFIQINNANDKLDTIINFIKQNLNYMGLNIFYNISKDYKNDPRVQELAKYLLKIQIKIDFTGFSQESFHNLPGMRV